MPTRDTAPIGAPCWTDLLTSDTARSRAFYTELFGWEAEEPNEQFGGYINFTRGGVRVAGCMTTEPGSGFPDAWGIYLATDDAAKTVDVATANGGQVVLGAMPVGDLGTMAVITDAAGATIGMWQPGQHPGFVVLGEPGAPSWFELQTRDYDRSIAFYRNVFRWDAQPVSDTAGFRYSTLQDGDTPLAGIMDAAGFLPDAVPSHWMVYFGVSDTDDAVARVTALGGSIVSPAEDTPYGRIAGAVDATGARFKLVAP
jgi:predicted enzyme related to lactoylglutathione lyase